MIYEDQFNELIANLEEASAFLKWPIFDLAMRLVEEGLDDVAIELLKAQKDHEKTDNNNL